MAEKIQSSTGELIWGIALAAAALAIGAAIGEMSDLDIDI